MMMVTLMVIAGIFASGQVIIQDKQIGPDFNKFDKALFSLPNFDMTKCDVYEDQHSKTYVPKMDKRNINWDHIVNVTFQLEYDEKLCKLPNAVLVYPIDFFCWGNGGSFTTYMNGQDGTFKGEYGAGLWDILVEFHSIDGYDEYYVLKESVDIHSDTTIVIDQRTSTNPMKIISRMPNGDVYDPSKQTYGDHTIRHGMYEMSLIRKSDGINFLSVYGHEDGECLFINDVSDRFYPVYNSFFWNDNDSYYLIDHTSLDFCFPHENDPADWECLEESFQPSAIDDGEPNSAGICATSCFNGLAVHSLNFGFEPGTLTNEAVKIYVNAPKRDDEYVLLTQARYGHGAEVITNYEDGNGNIVFSDTTIRAFYINGVPTIVENGVKHYINNYPTGLSLFAFNNEDGLVARHGYPGNPAFSFTENQKTSDFGSGTPICLFLSYEVAQRYPNWCFAYVGRYGEVREVDQLKVDMNMAVNGTEVCNSISQMNQFLMDPNRPTGEIDVTMTNDNIVVDELQGKNFAQMHIDEANDDKCVPSLSMLWFKNGEGKITDRFANSEDGLLEFSAGDFNATYDASVSDYTWFECQQPDVEISYAPYGEDNWNELDVEEIPENFCMPCYGHFYRGSLAGVTGEALKGWFDLKIRLTDAAGNWQEQVISPAFRIDGLAYTSVATVGSDNAREVARYSIDGKRVDASHRGVTIIKMSDGSAQKVLVK